MNGSNTPPRSLSTDQLHAALGDIGGPARPDYLAAIVARAGRSRQRPAWTIPEWWLPVDIAVRREGLRRAAVLAAALVLLALLAAAGVYIGSRLNRAVDLGIFEPVAGRIVYYEDPSLWGVDPNEASPASSLVRLGADGQFRGTVPLGWSRDGTKLLFLRGDPNPPDRQPPFERLLYILHADGTETPVTPGPVRNAAISPDGSRVAFSTRDVPGRTSRLPEGLYVADAEGGEPVRIAQEGTSPTFSSDGTQVAYLASPPGVTLFGVTGSAPVWVVNVDGTDAHEILAGEPGGAEGGFKRIEWSPAGDRIAMFRRTDPGQEETGAIYTFAPDGSEFTKVISGGYDPHWSPDGSRIAYDCLSTDDCSLAIADADGSSGREFDVGQSGPWHPGLPTIDEPAPSPATTAPAEPSPSPSPSTELAAPSERALTECTGTLASDDALTVGWCPTRPDGQQVRVAFRLTTRAPAWLNGEQNSSEDTLFFRPFGGGVQPGGTVAISVDGPATLSAWLTAITGEAAYAVSEPLPTSVGAAKGYLFDVSVAPGYTDVGDAPPLIENGAQSWELGDKTSRIWLVDHDGQPVMFVARPSFAGVESWARWVDDQLLTIEWE